MTRAFCQKPVDISYKYGQTYKKAKTNASGELIIEIPEQENSSDPNVYAKLKYEKDSSFLNMTLPVTKRKAQVGFYPEGGNLIQNIPCVLAWELKDQQLAMVSAKAVLYRNSEIIDTIETNSYGMGKFVLVPEAEAVYKIKLLHSAFADSNYILPPVLRTGLGITISDAVVKDTLVLRLINLAPQKIALRIHDFKETYIYNEMDIKSVHRSIKIPLADVASGLQTITISDSLGRPLAERLFYAHYDPATKINISTDKKIYAQREKVTLKLSLNQPDTLAFVSIACVQENRLSSAFTTDIESYIKLKNELTTLPIAANGKGIRDKKYLEDMLMVKGWRRYTWQNVLESNASDTLKTYDSLALHLNIRKYEKAIKAPVELSIMKGNGIGFKKSDAHGDVKFANQELILQAGTKMQAIVLGKNQDSYSMKISDPYIKLNKDYVKSLYTAQTAVLSSIQNNTELTLKANEKVNRLREVKITAGGDHSLNYKRGANACGDYVCMFNILNCRNHYSDAGNRHPVVGQTYRNGMGAGMITYHDCKDEEKKRFIMPLPGIYTRMEFYVDAHTEPLEPAFESTLYWNYGIILKPAEQELVFYTGDITGKFRIVVQGLTENDVTQEQYSFEVKGK